MNDSEFAAAKRHLHHTGWELATAMAHLHRLGASAVSEAEYERAAKPVSELNERAAGILAEIHRERGSDDAGRAMNTFTFSLVLSYTSNRGEHG